MIIICTHWYQLLNNGIGERLHYLLYEVLKAKRSNFIKMRLNILCIFRIFIKFIFIHSIFQLSFLFQIKLHILICIVGNTHTILVWIVRGTTIKLRHIKGRKKKTFYHFFLLLPLFKFSNGIISTRAEGYEAPRCGNDGVGFIQYIIA